MSLDCMFTAAGLGPSVDDQAAGAFTPGQQLMNHDKPCPGMDPTTRVGPLWDQSCMQFNTP